MKNWKDVKDVITPGGDPAWICPVCGDESQESYHVYGVECPENKLNRCPHCGEMLKYPWEKDKTNIDHFPLLVVTKGNTDGSLVEGDIVHYDAKGDLVLHLPSVYGGGWMSKEELTPEITDFEYVEHEKYAVKSINGREFIVGKDMV